MSEAISSQSNPHLKRKTNSGHGIKATEDAHKHPSHHHHWNSAIRNSLAQRDANELLSQMKDGSPITVKSDDSLYTAMVVLCEDKISSVPVIDSADNKKCVGFVDTLDVVSATVEILESNPTSEHFSKLKAVPSTTDATSAKSESSSENANNDDEDSMAMELMEQLIVQQISARAVTDYSKKDNFNLVSIHNNMLYIAKELLRQNTQRVAVQNDDGSFSGVITQSGFVEFLNEEFVENITTQKIHIRDIKLHSKLVTITTAISAFDAFKKMTTEGVSAIGIVSHHGILMDVISAADLTLWNEWVAAGEKFRFTDFSALKSPVKSYLDNSRSQREIPKRAPIMCTMNSKIEDVISDMLYNNIHSIFVTEDNRPIGIVTYADIVHELIRDD